MPLLRFHPLHQHHFHAAQELKQQEDETTAMMRISVEPPYKRTNPWGEHLGWFLWRGRHRARFYSRSPSPPFLFTRAKCKNTFVLGSDKVRYVLQRSRFIAAAPQPIDTPKVKERLHQLRYGVCTCYMPRQRSAATKSTVGKAGRAAHWIS